MSDTVSRIARACLALSAVAATSHVPSPALLAQATEPRTIDIVAKRFEFVPAVIEVTQGERIRLVVKSGDGLHGFGIKRFDLSKEVARGETVTIDFTPDAAGTFPILCTEFCGNGHEDMKGELVVKARPGAQP
jgi:cytochrome c oxidase subunit 2